MPASERDYTQYSNTELRNRFLERIEYGTMETSMRVSCEQCNQQYIINEDHLRGETSRFQCKKCSHYIIVPMPESALEQVASEESVNDIDFVDSIVNEEIEQPDSGVDEWADFDDQLDFDTEMESTNEQDDSVSGFASSTQPQTSQVKSSGTGVPLQTILSVTFLLGFLFMAAILVVLNNRYIPKLINEQIDLRTAAISKSFSGAVKQPLLIRNYLRVNQEAERVAQLPGVAYASVINKRNIVIAGVFSKPSLFQPTFMDMVTRGGFPQELARKNNLNPNEREKSAEFTIGGQPIYDVAISLGEVGGEVHVGLYTADIQAAVKKTVIPLLVVITILFIFGMIIFTILARNISKPLQDLTEMADRISMGEIDEQILPKGPKEVRDLGRSLDRMRISIRGALKRLQG